MYKKIIFLSLLSIGNAIADPIDVAFSLKQAQDHINKSYSYFSAGRVIAPKSKKQAITYFTQAGVELYSATTELNQASVISKEDLAAGSYNDKNSIQKEIVDLERAIGAAETLQINIEVLKKTPKSKDSTLYADADYLIASQNLSSATYNLFKANLK